MIFILLSGKLLPKLFCFKIHLVLFLNFHANNFKRSYDLQNRLILVNCFKTLDVVKRLFQTFIVKVIKKEV